jgi:hypothetical protein
MSQPDDLDRLLRELDAMNAPADRGAASGAKPPARRGESGVAKPAGKRRKGTASGRVAWTGASAIGTGVAGGVLGTFLTFLPAMSTMSTAVGAALGGAIAAFVSGPPRWFDDGE